MISTRTGTVTQSAQFASRMGMGMPLYRLIQVSLVTTENSFDLKFIVTEIECKSTMTKKELKILLDRFQLHHVMTL